MMEWRDLEREVTTIFRVLGQRLNTTSRSSKASGGWDESDPIVVEVEIVASGHDAVGVTLAGAEVRS